MWRKPLDTVKFEKLRPIKILIFFAARCFTSLGIGRTSHGFTVFVLEGIRLHEIKTSLDRFIR